jgi:hypothetical protein
MKALKNKQLRKDQVCNQIVYIHQICKGDKVKIIMDLKFLVLLSKNIFKVLCS